MKENDFFIELITHLPLDILDDIRSSPSILPIILLKSFVSDAELCELTEPVSSCCGN